MDFIFLGEWKSKWGGWERWQGKAGSIWNSPGATGGERWQGSWWTAVEACVNVRTICVAHSHVIFSSSLQWPGGRWQRRCKIVRRKPSGLRHMWKKDHETKEVRNLSREWFFKWWTLRSNRKWRQERSDAEKVDLTISWKFHSGLGDPSRDGWWEDQKNGKL